ncbi:MAG: hypothetical protein RIC93_10045 [Alphaproteobacteria bacterium]
MVRSLAAEPSSAPKAGTLDGRDAWLAVPDNLRSAHTTTCVVISDVRAVERVHEVGRQRAQGRAGLCDGEPFLGVDAAMALGGGEPSGVGQCQPSGRGHHERPGDEVVRGGEQHSEGGQVRTVAAALARQPADRVRQRHRQATPGSAAPPGASARCRLARRGRRQFFLIFSLLRRN